MVGVVSVYLVCGWYGIGMGSVKSVWLVCSQYVIVRQVSFQVALINSFYLLYFREALVVR